MGRTWNIYLSMDRKVLSTYFIRLDRSMRNIKSRLWDIVTDDNSVFIHRLTHRQTIQIASSIDIVWIIKLVTPTHEIYLNFYSFIRADLSKLDLLPEGTSFSEINISEIDNVKSKYRLLYDKIHLHLDEVLDDPLMTLSITVSTCPCSIKDYYLAFMGRMSNGNRGRHASGCVADVPRVRSMVNYYRDDDDISQSGRD